MANAADLAGVTSGVDGWTLVPLHDGAATSHIVAARDDDKARDTDIDVVLYIRTAEGWEAEAYEPSTGKEDALIALAAEFGLPNPMSGDWGIEDLDPEAVTGFAPPRAAFKTGFFADDPLSDAASGMSDPGPLVEAAETLGLPAAGSAVNTGSLGAVPIDPIDMCGCQQVPCIQAAIAAGVDAKLSDPSLTFEEVVAITGAEFYLTLGCCFPGWHSETGPWSDWTCPNPTWINVGREPGSSGSDECVYERVVERSRMRVYYKRCIDCTQIWVVQTRFERGIQRVKDLIDTYDPDCPATPDSELDVPECEDGPSALTGGTNTTPWQPPIPPCP